MLFLFNTLTQKKEPFNPLRPPHVTMYSCGPTVYDIPHIGNLRAYIMTDVLRRTLEFNGYDVYQVMNVTDVGHLVGDGDSGEDKMTRALKREGKPLTLESMKEVGDFYTKRFLNDIEALNIKPPHKLPKASDHINEDIELILKLEEKGFAYKTSDGVYFDTSKYENYGKLGDINIEGGDQTRIKANPEKKNPDDFALWKFSLSSSSSSGGGKNGWESPWGKGFPGWHIECSAMSRKYLGDEFDIHTGGIDHIPTHHNNEIAQTESALGQNFKRNESFAKYWIHNAHVIQNGGKMAKSAGEFITLKTLSEKGISLLAYRYLVLQANYRTQMQFSFEALESAARAYEKLRAHLENAYPQAKTSEIALEKIKEKIKSIINDDMDTPRLLAFVWETMAEKNLSEKDYGAVMEADKILGLDLFKKDSSALDIPKEIQALVDEREKARTDKDWKKSDEIRENISKAGYHIEDTAEGTKIRKIK